MTGRRGFRNGGSASGSVARSDRRPSEQVRIAPRGEEGDTEAEDRNQGCSDDQVTTPTAATGFLKQELRAISGRWCFPFLRVGHIGALWRIFDNRVL
jgi:hypothetical protein